MVMGILSKVISMQEFFAHRSCTFEGLSDLIKLSKEENYNKFYHKNKSGWKSGQAIGDVGKGGSNIITISLVVEPSETLKDIIEKVNSALIQMFAWESRNG